jgi:mannose-6-phosphate isomerase-like protein (cupin superfamily)
LHRRGKRVTHDGMTRRGKPVSSPFRQALSAAAAILALALPGAAHAQDAPAPAPTPPAGLAVSGDELRAKAAAMTAGMGDAGFAWEAVLRDGDTVAAIEVWRRPGKPALHPDEAEYALVLEGSGTLLSGGTMADATQTRPGLVEGSRIEGGTTRTLAPGDVILVPAGVPHWFGVDGKLVLLGMKLPRHTR